MGFHVIGIFFTFLCFGGKLACHFHFNKLSRTPCNSDLFTGITIFGFLFFNTHIRKESYKTCAEQGKLTQTTKKEIREKRKK